MTENDFKNIEDIKRILKYIDKGKLDPKIRTNALKLKKSLDQLMYEHSEYLEHMRNYH